MKTTGFIFAKKRFFLGCLLLIINSISFAQSSGFEKGLSKNWSLNLNAGPTIYWGYFSDSKSISTAFKHGISLGYGIVLTKQISPVIGIRGQLLIGSLKARKDFYGDGLPADLNLTSDLAEGNISAKISLTDLIRGYNPKRVINVYGLVGIGLSNFNGRVVSSVSGDTLYTIGNGTGKGIRGWEIDGMATGGVGLSVRVNKNIDITAEASMKFFKTDKLGRVRGLMNYDMYSYSSIGITYKIAVPKETKQTLPTPVQSKPVVVKKEVASPSVTENKPIEKKEEVIPAAVPVKTVNKPVIAEPVKKPEVKNEEVKIVDKVVSEVDNNQYSGYKVQILATKKTVSFETIKQDYKINEQIREDQSGKWYRFSIGEFQSFEEAKAYANQLIIKNNAKDAFVVKFVNGKRVGPVYR